MRNIKSFKNPIYIDDEWLGTILIIRKHYVIEYIYDEHTKEHLWKFADTPELRDDIIRWHKRELWVNARVFRMYREVKF